MRSLKTIAVVISCFVFLGTVHAAPGKAKHAAPVPKAAQDVAVANLQHIDPATLRVNDLDSLKWDENPSNGVLTSYLVGDPAKEGLYVALVKWPPHKMSHPHFHPNDRYVTVLSGVWWVGTGRKFDPDHTVPLKAGTVVTHFGKHVHYDGAKDEGCTLEIIGMGPASITPAEDK